MQKEKRENSLTEFEMVCYIIGVKKSWKQLTVKQRDDKMSDKEQIQPETTQTVNIQTTTEQKKTEKKKTDRSRNRSGSSHRSWDYI